MLNVQINNPRTLDPVIRSVSKFAERETGSIEVAKRIFIDTVDTNIRFTATDLSSTVSYLMPIDQVHSHGAVCVNAKNLSQLAKLAKLSADEGLTLSETEKGLQVSFSESTFSATFKTADPDEFPAHPDNITGISVILTPAMLKSVKSVAKSASTQSVRPAYQNVHFTTIDSKLHTGATDGNIITGEVLGETETDIDFAIPVDTLKKAFQVATGDLGKLNWQITVSDDTERLLTEIKIGETRILFRTEDCFENLFDFTADAINETQQSLTITYKALAAAIKPLSKVFEKGHDFTNLLILEADADTVSLTARAFKNDCHMEGVVEDEDGNPDYSDVKYVHTTDLVTEQVHTFDADDVMFVGDTPVSFALDATEFPKLLETFKSDKPSDVYLRFGKHIVMGVDTSKRIFVAMPDTKSYQKIYG